MPVRTVPSRPRQDEFEVDTESAIGHAEKGIQDALDEADRRTIIRHAREWWKLGVEGNKVCK